MSRKGIQVMSWKQHQTPTMKINNKTPLHPPTHKKEDLTVIQGSSSQSNTKQLIITKKDTNSY